MSRRETEFEHGLVTEEKQKLKKPPLYKVLLHNDDYTTMEFVVFILRTVFNRSETDAFSIMLKVHTEGIGVAGVFTYEIAESKISKAADLARQYEFPFLCSMEED